MRDFSRIVTESQGKIMQMFGEIHEKQTKGEGVVELFSKYFGKCLYCSFSLHIL